MDRVYKASLLSTWHQNHPYQNILTSKNQDMKASTQIIVALMAVVTAQVQEGSSAFIKRGGPKAFSVSRSSDLSSDGTITYDSVDVDYSLAAPTSGDTGEEEAVARTKRHIGTSAHCCRRWVNGSWRRLCGRQCTSILNQV